MQLPLLALLAAAPLAAAWRNGAALTPPMGFGMYRAMRNTCGIETARAPGGAPRLDSLHTNPRRTPLGSSSRSMLCRQLERVRMRL